MKRVLTFVAMLVLLLVATTSAACAQEIIPEVSTLAELQDAITQADDGDTIKITQTIEITESVTVGIEGKRVKLAPYGCGTVFRIEGVQDGDVIWVQNLDLETESTGTESAIIIDVSAQIFLNKVSFNNLGGEYGGAVNITRGTVFIQGSDFTNCSASVGGAVYVDTSGTCTISECAFTGNTATFNGGAVYSCGKIDISDSNFTRNFAVNGNGGGVCGLDMTLIRCTITGNTCYSSGGGVRSDANATIKDCVIYDNSASVSASDLSVGGTAAITVENSSTLYGGILTEKGFDSWSWYTDQAEGRYSAETPTATVEETQSLTSCDLVFVMYNAPEPEPTPTPTPEPDYTPSYSYPSYPQKVEVKPPAPKFPTLSCGKADSSFRPNNMLTFGELLAVLTRFVEPQEGYIGSFNILDHWAAPAAITAASLGWIDDVPIDLNAPATYGSLANLLIKIYGL